MMAQAGHPVMDADGILQRGVILRHLAIPGHIDDSFKVIDQMAAWNDADPGCFIPSLMSQFTPFYQAAQHGIGRRITTYEYRRVVNYAMDKGLTAGYMQQRAAPGKNTPPASTSPASDLLFWKKSRQKIFQLVPGNCSGLRYVLPAVPARDSSFTFALRASIRKPSSCLILKPSPCSCFWERGLFVFLNPPPAVVPAHFPETTAPHGGPGGRRRPLHRED